MNSKATSRSSLPLALILGCALSSSACRTEAETETILVFAAASLSSSFEDLAAAYERIHPQEKVVLNFAGTPTLVLQLKEGAPADIFASADIEHMNRVDELGLLGTGPQIFARNALTIVVARGNPRGVDGLESLSRPGLDVVLCGPEVPAGRYAREALRRAGLSVSSRSDESSVKAVVNRVALGEADAGIVYVTDIEGRRDEVEALPIDAAHNVESRYPIAVLRSAGESPSAAAFQAFVLSEEGQAILSRHGFARP